MNVNEAKSILLLYRPGTADAEEQPMAEALNLAKNDPALSDWLKAHLAQQEALRAKFLQITPPAGLKEQILSEHAAGRRRVSQPAKMRFALVALVLLGLGILALVWLPRHDAENTLPRYQNEMVSLALRGYAMDIMTNDPAPIRAYLAQNHAPADFAIPASLSKATLVGCTVEDWQGTKVSLVCFQTGRPLRPGAASDLWLFVVDRKSVKNPHEALQIAKVNRLITATWLEGDKLYFLGTDGETRDLEQYL